MHKVLMFHARYAKPGGEEQSAAAEAALLRANGHQVELVVWPNAAISVREAAINCVWSETAYRLVQEAINDVRPDVVHFQNVDYRFGPAAIRAASDLGVPVVKALRNARLLVGVRAALVDPYNGSRLQGMTIAIGNAVHRNATWRHHVDLFLPVSEHLRRRFVASGWPVARLASKPNVVWPEPRVTPRRVRRRFLFAGRLSAEKGVDVLLAAWRLLGADAPELALVGDGPMDRLSTPFAPGYFRIRWLGQLPHHRVLELMSESLAVLVPSTWAEPFGRVAIEALAVGTPTIVSDAGGLSETEPTMIVPPGDPEAIACAVRTLLRQSEANYAEWRREARQRYETNFAPVRQVAALRAAYDLAADHRRARVAALVRGKVIA